MTDRNYVVLVNEQDEALEVMDKLEAHQQGLLHRAFSVFIMNTKSEMLLQQRAAGKYHGAGLWTNACCSHPQLDEDLLHGATERLAFEMGFTCALTPLFSFVYHASVENSLIEHEYDHVYFGLFDANPLPNPEEVQDYKWVPLKDLECLVAENPAQFTYWFRHVYLDVVRQVTQTTIHPPLSCAPKMYI